MNPAKRANWRFKGDQQSSPGRGRGHGGQIYANCNFNETSASRSNVNYASPTISSTLRTQKTGQTGPDKTPNMMKGHQEPLKKLLDAKLQEAEKSLEKSPNEDKEEEEEKDENQVVGEIIYMANHASGCQNNAQFADALSPVFDEEKEGKDDFTCSTGSFSPPSHGAEEKAPAEDGDDHDEESFDGGELMDGNLKEQSEAKEDASKKGSEGDKEEAKSDMITPKAQRLPHQNATKEGRLEELQEKVNQLQAKLMELQEVKKKIVVVGKSKPPPPMEESFSPLPPLTAEQMRIIASDKCSSGAAHSPPADSSSKATLVLDGVHHMPLPRDFNRMPSVQRDILLVALPEEVRASYLNMCWEARFFEQMTITPIKAEEAHQELLLSLKL